MVKKINPIIIPAVVFIVSLGAAFAGWIYNIKVFEAVKSEEVQTVLISNFPRYIALSALAGSIALFGIVLSLVTSRRRAVDIAEIMTTSLKSEKHKLGSILSFMGEGLIAVSDEGRILLMNQSAQAFLGVAEADAKGQKVEKFLKLLKENEPFPENEYPVYKAMRGQDIARIYTHDNVSVKDSYGRVFPVALSAVSLLGKGAEGVSAIVVFRDVSTEKAVEEAKTEFVSLAAHQLRMPLTTVRWYSEMLLAGDVGVLNKGQKEYMDEIYESNRRMVTLVNQLLNVSRIRLGNFKIEPTPTDLSKIVESVIAEFKPYLATKQMQVVKNYRQDLEKWNADPNLIRVIFQNLISNAVKYTPDRGIITISIKEEKNLSISVSDTGYGIPKIDQHKIFTQLYRADNIKEKDVDGTGLGLYMVKAIVEQSGGAISFHSEENKGTTFHITFPRSGMRAKSGTKSLT